MGSRLWNYRNWIFARDRSLQRVPQGSANLIESRGVDWVGCLAAYSGKWFEIRLPRPGNPFPSIHLRQTFLMAHQAEEKESGPPPARGKGHDPSDIKEITVASHDVHDGSFPCLPALPPSSMKSVWRSSRCTFRESCLLHDRLSLVSVM